MIRLLVTAEGPTERNFVKRILYPHLVRFGVFADARCVLTSRDNRTSREFRGGMTTYQKAKNDIISWLKEDNRQECRFTTMFDLQRLPNSFPGYHEALSQADPYHKVALLERSLKEDIGDRRFIPYIQLHEFEALILSDPQKLDWEYLEHDRPIKDLIAMMQNFENPELVNSNPEQSPSKRILNKIPEYDKVTAGVSVVEKIGLDVLRTKCQHFNEWLCTLEMLGSPQ
jgi:hypothetical protein